MRGREAVLRYAWVAMPPAPCHAGLSPETSSLSNQRDANSANGKLVIMANLECERCHERLTAEVKLLADGAMLCTACYAGAQQVERAPRPAHQLSAWVRPQFFRRHGTLVSLLLGASALLGAPFALYGLVFLPAFTLGRVTLAYALIFTLSLWSAIVRATAPPSLPAPHPPPAAPHAFGSRAPGPAQALGAAAGPTMVIAGFGVVAIAVLIVAAVAAAYIAYLLWVFLHPTNVG